jgi:enoyl-CoA hydratase/carnithine racemase
VTALRVERDGGLAVVTLEHPPLNLFDHQVFDALEETAGALESEPPRAALFRAVGKVVSGGVDVAVFEGLVPEEAAALWRRLLGVIQRLEALPFPTLFAAHALTLTAAFEVALACDVIVAARSARFGFPENVVGLTPSMGGTQRLAARAGSAFARGMVLTGELVEAETLERRGIVYRVWDDAELDGRARELATRLSEGPTQAHAATKQILRAFAEGGVRCADEIVPEVSGALWSTEDLKAAVRSFLQEGPGRATFGGY